MKTDIIIQSSSKMAVLPSPLEKPAIPATTFDRLKANRTEEEEEGSGSALTNDDEEGFAPTKEIDGLPLKDATSAFLEDATTNEATLLSKRLGNNKAVFVNVTTCVCSRIKDGWRIARQYSNLRCDEVKNTLPIFLVASCVVTVVEAVLSGVFLYLVWAFQKRVCTRSYGGTLHEVQPFIHRSNFKNSQHQHILNNTINGTLPYR